jgi:hypothetical protein
MTAWAAMHSVARKAALGAWVWSRDARSAAVAAVVEEVEEERSSWTRVGGGAGAAREVLTMERWWRSVAT